MGHMKEYGVEKPVIRIGLNGSVDFPATGLDAFGLSPWGKELENLFLESVAMNSWNLVLEGLRNKNIDGAFIPVPAAIKLVAAGTNIRFLLLGPRSSSWLIKSCAAGIRSFKDFMGHTIFVPHELSMETLLVHRLMASGGLRFGRDISADVVFEPMAASMMIEALGHDKEGRIGGFIAEEPFGSIAVKAGTGKRFCESETLWPGHPQSVFVLKGFLVESFPDAVSELLRLLVQGKGFSLPDLKTFGIIKNYMKENMGFDDCEMDLAESLKYRFSRDTGVVS